MSLGLIFFGHETPIYPLCEIRRQHGLEVLNITQVVFEELPACGALRKCGDEYFFKCFHGQLDFLMWI